MIDKFISSYLVSSSTTIRVLLITVLLQITYLFTLKKTLLVCLKQNQLKINLISQTQPF